MEKKVILAQKNPDILDIIQITDCHLYSTDNGRFDGVDTGASLARVIDSINAGETPDAVLVTGDLVHDGEQRGYQRLLDALRRLRAGVYCLPGNHDKPKLMQQILNAANVTTDKVLQARDWYLVLLDTVLPDTHAGRLSGPELDFLEETLRAAGERFVLVAMHHHPVSVHSRWMDAMMLENPEDFFAVIDRYPAVRAISWGHIHQVFSRRRHDIALLGTPSTCRQFRLAGDSAAMDERAPPAYRRTRLHRDGRLDSEIHWIKQ